MTQNNLTPSEEQIPAEDSQKFRNASRIAMAVFGGSIIGGVFNLFQAWQSGAWQMYALVGLLFVFSVFAFVAMRMTRGGRVETGVWIIIIGMFIVIPIGTLLISDIGLIAGIILVVTTYVYASQSLQAKDVRRILVASIAIGVLTAVTDFLNLEYRLQVPVQQSFAPSLVALVLLFVGFFIVRRVWRSNIRAKLLIAFIGVTLVAAGVLGTFMYITTSNNLRANLERELTAQATDRAIRIGNLFNEQINALTTLSLNKGLQQELDIQNNSYLGSQAILQARDKQWRIADAEDNNNIFLVQWNLTNAIARELTEYQQTFPANIEVFATDVYGGLAGSTNRTSDYYQADEDWWQAAYNDGQGGVYIGKPEFDESAGAVGVQIALPVRDNNTGEIVGILRTTYELSALEPILVGNVGETGSIDLFIPGEPVTYIREGTIQGVTPGLFERLQEVYGQGMVELDYKSALSVITQAPVQTLEGNPAVDNLGWVVVLSQHRDEAFAPINSQVRGIIILLAIVVALAAAAAYFFSLFLVRPILHLTATAEHVSAGDLSSRVEVTTADEVGTLATAFNTMTSRLQETLGGLEQRVADRTRNLELAAEVGRSVSQVRALDFMLKDACQLILDEFDLYYVQVYLADPSQTNLVLEAGTGEVGAQLLERAHRLPLNTGSINGRAAIEKRAVVISDTSESATFRSNELLPDTRGEMAVPLIVADKVVGVLDMQTTVPGKLNEEVLPAFEALAGQLAVAVQNAKLVAEAEQARADVEAQSRRLVRTGWVDYMDAIHKPEHFGFVFDRNEVTPLDETDELPDKGRAVSAPISVTGEMLGSLVVELEDSDQNEQTGELVNIVARQMAQQIENLRLLESAERYRFEAEQAARRQTRESWREYVGAKAGESLGYLYDLNEVRPYNNGHDAETDSLNLPLKVSDETVGKLAIRGLTPDDRDSLELVNAVAERLGAHIEGLRLTQEIQSRAQREQTLRQITNAVRSSTDLTTILRTAVRELGSVMGRRAVIRMAMPDQSDGEDQVPDKNGSSENADGGMNS